LHFVLHFTLSLCNKSKNNMSKFNTLHAAESYRLRCVSPSKWALINGCDGLIWLVSNREASRLVKQGYELV